MVTGQYRKMDEEMVKRANAWSLKLNEGFVYTNFYSTKMSCCCSSIPCKLQSTEDCCLNWCLTRYISLLRKSIKDSGSNVNSSTVNNRRFVRSKQTTK